MLQSSPSQPLWVASCTRLPLVIYSHQTRIIMRQSEGIGIRSTLQAQLPSSKHAPWSALVHPFGQKASFETTIL